VAETEAELAQAQRNRARAERLLAAKATPAKRLEEARRDETVAMARHETAQKRLRQLEETIRSGGGGSDEAFIDLITPLSGVLVKSNATPGAAVETGEKLFQIVDPDLVYVVGAVPEAEVHRVRETIGVELHIPGRDEPVVLNSRVSLGAAVDPASRTVPIVYQVENREGLLLVGQAVSLVLVTHEALSALSIPMTALVDEGGQSIVYVQVGGEDFARRQLDIGIRDRDYVQVLSGLGEGERIVTRGAYEVRLASLSGTIPAEGHVH
jgi:RND family efflux transporter MFP subunit